MAKKEQGGGRVHPPSASVLGSKMSNDVAKAIMNKIWGILFSPTNTAGMAKLAGCKG